MIIDASERHTALPPRLLPILYIAFAHLSLALALLAVAVDPRSVAGFFYHARMVGIVHLVTLGWISASILGSIYIVGPMALRMPLPATRLDYWACASTTIGIAGMVSHFWIEEFSGMAWSALMVTAGFVHVAIRVLRALPAARVPRAVKLHIALAFLNVLGAAAMGVLLGFDKVGHFLPGFVLSNVYAHAHLAAIGWAAMMIVGVGHRLLPMVLPAAPPHGRMVYASAILLEAGALGLFVTLLARSAWVSFFAVIVCAGLGAFFFHVAWMLRHGRKAPVGLVRPDYGILHVFMALICFGISVVLGLVLAFAPMSEWSLRAALAYGVFGLLGFAQMVVGMESRILPIFAWYWAYANTAFKVEPCPIHQMRVRSVEGAAFYLWLFGLPCVAGGLFFDAVPLLAAGAWALFAAVVLRTASAAAVLRHAFVRRRDGSDRRIARGAATSPAQRLPALRTR